MQLWNDYEGKTLAGIFPVETLLSTGGRNAFFATHGRDGRPAVLRLTEALNDQEEMRARYTVIQGIRQPNLVSIEDFGDVIVEGTPLIYVVMEPTQENLAEIVRERPLTVEETGEIAVSLAAALEALHAHGLVHGHMEPASVLAAGTVVKLRSDCVRPVPLGADGESARAKDVFGLADVLTQCFTQSPLQDASDALALPEPYASIVRNVVRGQWGLEQVASELRRFVRSAAPAPASLSSEPAVTVSAPVAAASEALPADTSSPVAPVRLGRTTVRDKASEDPQLPLVYAEPPSRRATRKPGAVSGNTQQAESAARSRWSKPAAQVSSPLVWGAVVLVVCLLALFVWHFSGTESKTHPVVASAAAPAAFAPPPPEQAGRPDGTAHSAAPAAPLPQHAYAEAAPAGGSVWRVVAYTYNMEAQAHAKAKLIAERHSDLRPQVFSRTGRAPYLVTLGGTMTRQQAASMLQHAHSDGLARDIYMQNYSH